MTENETKVLIVDDTPQNVELLHRMLSHQNYSVSGVPSGKVALDVVKRFKPDVILLDVMMPELNGFETCERLKADPETSMIPVIFITAKTDATDIAEGFKVGGADYIFKPAREEEVWARVGHQVQLKKLIDNKNSLIKQLHQMERRNREIVNRASDPIMVISEKGLIDSANPAAAQMFKFSMLELIGQRFTDFISPLRRDKYVDCFNQTMSQIDSCSVINDGPAELSILDKNGDEIPVDLSISQIGLESPKFLCLLHDLSLHHKLVKQLRELSLVDKLTGIANRRKLDDFYSNEWYRCLRNQTELSVLFMDIDHFKKYNDSYGHQMGDNCLKLVASVLESRVSRPSDLVARYGGEEFVAVLSDTSYVGAMEVAEKIRQKVELLNQEHDSSPIANRVTLSIGVATCIPTESIDSESLLKAADDALYQAKANGRNQVFGSLL